MYQRGGEHSKVAKKLTEDLLLNLQAREALGRALDKKEGKERFTVRLWRYSLLQSNTTTFPSTKDKKGIGTN